MMTTAAASSSQFRHSRGGPRRPSPLAGTIVLLALTATALSLPGGALASHFRGGWIEYEVEEDGLTVNFKLISSWKSSSVRWSSVNFQFGDGGRSKSIRLGNYNTDPELTQLYSDRDYKTILAEFKYVYSRSGFYKVGFNSYARVSSLRNSANSAFSLYSGFQLAAGLKSPTVSVPAILQIPTNAINQIPLIALPQTGPNPDCAVVSRSDSGIVSTPSLSSGGQATMLPSPCTLQWDTTGARLNDLYAYQYRYQIPGDPNYMSVDFVMKIVSDPPSCMFSDGGNGQYVVAMGSTLSFDVDVDEVNGRDVTLSTMPSPLRTGMSANPAVSQSASVPAKYTFTFTPQPGDQGLSLSLNMFFSNTLGIKCMVAPTIAVREISPPPPSPPLSPPPARYASPPNTEPHLHQGYPAVPCSISCCMPCCLRQTY